MKESIMVVDFGTSNVRTNLVDIDTGKILCGYSKPVFYTNDKADFHEINIDDYWLASVETTGKVITNMEKDITIIGLIFSYIGDSLVPVDKNGKPLYNMIASYDLRAKNDMAPYTETLGIKNFEEITGCPLTPRNTGVKIYWLKKYMPEIRKEAKYYLTIQQYINLKLGLGPVSDYSVANRKLILDVRTKKWSKPIMELLDSNEEEQGDKIVGGDVQIGRITQYGDVKLPSSIPVFPGGHDSAVGFFGLGLNKDNTTILGNVGGTFDHYGYLSDHYRNTLKETGIQTVAGPTSDSYVTIKAHPAGKDLLWFMHEIVQEKDMGKLNSYFHNSTWDGSNPMFYSAKMDIEKGFFLNMGITSGHQQIFDTLVEGMTFLSRDFVTMFEQLHSGITKVIRIGGGSGKSDEWPQLKADVFGCQIEKVKNLEVSSVGAAIIACIGLGICNYQEAFQKMVSIDKVFTPDSEKHEKYIEKFNKWKFYSDMIK